jgi:hypothetical protein
MNKYQYEFKDRNRIVDILIAETLTEALERFNKIWETKYKVAHEFLHMAVITQNGMYNSYGVTWSPVN